jgi:hypothetical protein
MRNQIIFIIIVFAVAGLLIFSTGNTSVEKAPSAYSDPFYDYETVTYATFATIVPPLVNNSPLIGFNIDPNKLDFGVLPGNGSSSKRIINITNIKDKGIKISVRAYGSMAPLLSFNSDFDLKAREKTTVDVIFNTDNMPLGNYTGRIELTIKIPK